MNEDLTQTGNVFNDVRQRRTRDLVLINCDEQGVALFELLRHHSSVFLSRSPSMGRIDSVSKRCPKNGTRYSSSLKAIRSAVLGPAAGTLNSPFDKTLALS